MRINANDCLIGERCILVPYCQKHVSKYHSWMEDEELREATCSERLTFEQELQMQQAWGQDQDKLTFIVLDKETFVKGGEELPSMAGDINAFTCVDSDCAIEETSSGKESSNCFELSVMVAEPRFRRRGIAKEACTLMIAYILERVDSNARFLAKIGVDNALSIALFRDRLVFRQCAYSEVFKLATFGLGSSAAKKLIKNTELRLTPYIE